MALFHWSRSLETGITTIDAQHKLEHRELKNMLAEHMRKFDSGKMETFDFLAFLVDWVQDHIIESDQVFGRFLTAKLNP